MDMLTRSAFAASIALTAVSVWPGMARSNTRYRHASACFVPAGANTTPGTTLDVDAGISGGRLANLAMNNNLEMYCPIMDDDNLPKSAIRRVKLDAYDGSVSGRIFAQACAAFQTGGGVGERCGPAYWSDAAGQGAVSTTVDVSALQAAAVGDYAYLHLSIPTATAAGSTTSTFWGYSWSDVP
jgi:hypothetical protein